MKEKPVKRWHVRIPPNSQIQLDDSRVIKNTSPSVNAHLTIETTIVSQDGISHVKQAK